VDSSETDYLLILIMCGVEKSSHSPGKSVVFARESPVMTFFIQQRHQLKLKARVLMKKYTFG